MLGCHLLVGNISAEFDRGCFSLQALVDSLVVDCLRVGGDIAGEPDWTFFLLGGGISGESDWRCFLLGGDISGESNQGCFLRLH